jgi:hypothetical protein
LLHLAAAFQILKEETRRREARNKINMAKKANEKSFSKGDIVVMMNKQRFKLEHPNKGYYQVLDVRSKEQVLYTKHYLIEALGL